MLTCSPRRSFASVRRELSFRPYYRFLLRYSTNGLCDEKCQDVRRVLVRQLSMWSNGDYDLLVQEAIRCDRSLKHKCKYEEDEAHLVSIFTYLMLHEKVRAASDGYLKNQRVMSSCHLIKPESKVPMEISFKCLSWIH